jgi:hypothetical protein
VVERLRARVVPARRRDTTLNLQELNSEVMRYRVCAPVREHGVSFCQYKQAPDEGSAYSRIARGEAGSSWVVPKELLSMVAKSHSRWLIESDGYGRRDEALWDISHIVALSDSDAFCSLQEER